MPLGECWKSGIGELRLNALPSWQAVDVSQALGQNREGLLWAFSEVPHSSLTALAGESTALLFATGEVLLQNDCESGLGLRLMDIVASADSWV